MEKYQLIKELGRGGFGCAVLSKGRYDGVMIDLKLERLCVENHQYWEVKK